MADLNGPGSPRRSNESLVEGVARGGGEIALSYFRSLATVRVERKGHLDLVTKADKEVEAFLIAKLREAFPNDGIYGEEGDDIPGDSGRVWVIDPIDGTLNFVRGDQNWAISIGLYQNRRPVYGVIYAPVRDLMFSGGETVETRLNGEPARSLPALDLSQASVGIGLHPSVATADRLELMRYISDDLRISFRCCGSSTLSLIAVAMGETCGYVALGDSTWDVMAALPILRNLACRIPSIGVIPTCGQSYGSHAERKGSRRRCARCWRGSAARCRRKLHMTSTPIPWNRPVVADSRRGTICCKLAGRTDDGRV